MVKIGIIGGTGLDNPDLIRGREEKEVNTPFGKPSDKLILGKVAGISCVLISRHDRRHTINPTNINYRANVWALKQEGCDCIIATTACGSLQKDIHPGDFVVLDQVIDWTTKRLSTFYDGAPGSPVGVCHIPMANSFSAELRTILIQVLKDLGKKNYHPTGTNIIIEGPRYSSRAESKLFQSFGASVVGMTTIPEVVLANEAAIPYAALALVTNYDCWKDDENNRVSVEMVKEHMKKNAAFGVEVLLKAIPRVAAYNWEPVKKSYQETLKTATMMP